jgi:hypothetical protein
VSKCPAAAGCEKVVVERFLVPPNEIVANMQSGTPLCINICSLAKPNLIQINACKRQAQPMELWQRII